MSPKRQHDPPAVLDRTLLASDGSTERWALRIAEPTGDPRTVLEKFRASGVEANTLNFHVEDGKVARVEVYCTVHKNSVPKRVDDDGNREGEAW